MINFSNSQTKRFLFIGVALLVSACSVKGGDNGAPLTSDPFNGKTRIAGPQVEGEWASGCVLGSGGTHRQVAIKFQGGKFERVETDYSDSACLQSAKTTAFKGTFIFSKQNADNSYQIEYAIAMDNGWTQLTEEKLILENDDIFISEFQIGELATVNRQMPLKKKTGPTPISTAPTDCLNYSGRFMMNTDDFEITQTSCAQVAWADQPTYFNNNPQTLTYIADGVERTYGKRIRKVYFENQLLNFSYKNSSNQNVVEKWSFQKKPCNLYNPDGSDYLTRAVWIDGQYSSRSCAFWSRHH